MGIVLMYTLTGIVFFLAAPRAHFLRCLVKTCRAENEYGILSENKGPEVFPSKWSPPALPTSTTTEVAGN